MVLGINHDELGKLRKTRTCGDRVLVQIRFRIIISALTLMMKES